ncbi:uncharacterized protein BDW70DRAFT_96274 [Aspergillus foveolatus]|uniref:uncharacterized protein n=1 Tax=Aspergillus foveolatus TaxID=210207 RepID=UPI003CCE0753
MQGSAPPGAMGNAMIVHALAQLSQAKICSQSRSDLELLSCQLRRSSARASALDLLSSLPCHELAASWLEWCPGHGTRNVMPESYPFPRCSDPSASIVQIRQDLQSSRRESWHSGAVLTVGTPRTTDISNI